MKKYKYVGSSEQACQYPFFVECGREYIGEEAIYKSNRPTEYWASEFPDEWELVVEEVKTPKKYKFLGDFKAIDDGSYGGLVINNIYSLTDKCPWNEGNGDLDKYNFVKYYVELYPNDWEEVTEQAKQQIFTDAEVVTLITFLNDNFEDFEVCINEPQKGGIIYETYLELFGEFSVDKANLLIDKLEKNTTPLTDAEKVTLIHFLNDRFEDFVNFIGDEYPWTLSCDNYDLLNGSIAKYKASNLIDKIELS